MKSGGCAASLYYDKAQQRDEEGMAGERPSLRLEKLVSWLHGLSNVHHCYSPEPTPGASSFHVLLDLFCALTVVVRFTLSTCWDLESPGIHQCISGEYLGCVSPGGTTMTS